MTGPKKPVGPSRSKPTAHTARTSPVKGTPIQPWQPAPLDLIHAFETEIARIPEAEPKKMFGYPAALVNGNLFTGLHQSNWIVRLSDIDRARLLKVDGALLFQPMPGRPMREYVVLPESIVRVPDELHEWILRAMKFALGVTPRPPRQLAGARLRRKQ